MISLLKRAGVASDQTEEKESSQNEKDGNQVGREENMQSYYFIYISCYYQ